MEFVDAGWCAGNYLRLDRAIGELDMFDNYYIAHKASNIITILSFNQIKFCYVSCYYTLR